MFLESVGICLFGMSYQERYLHWAQGFKLVDYRISLQNYRDKIFSRIDQYDVFCSTYNHKLINTLKNDFNTTNVLISNETPIAGLETASKLQRNKMIGNFEPVLKNTSHEWYLFTRFDLLFNFHFDELILDKHKINVLAFLESDNLICDNFYVVHRNLLPTFFKYINQKQQTNRHDVNFFGGAKNIHVLTNERGKWLGDLNCYKIVNH